ncbi:hypothetical protein EJB05_00855, partial [Eragrostis curvula]
LLVRAVVPPEREAAAALQHAVPDAAGEGRREAEQPFCLTSSLFLGMCTELKLPFFFGIPRSTQWRVADGSGAGAGGGRLILACARHAIARAAGHSTAEAASGRPPDWYSKFVTCPDLIPRDMFLLSTFSCTVVARRYDEEAELAREERAPSRGSIYAIVQNYKSAEALPEIHDLWHNFLRASALDYQRISQKELTKCKTEDQKAAAKFIGVAELMKYSVRSMA